MVARWGLLLALLLLVLWVGGADGVYHQDLRWRAVWLHEDDGYDFAEIALLLRVHHTTIRRWIKLFYKIGDVTPSRRRRRSGKQMPGAISGIVILRGGGGVLTTHWFVRQPRTSDTRCSSFGRTPRFTCRSCCGN